MSRSSEKHQYNESPIALPELAALKAGDEAAWEQAFRYFWPRALAAARRAGACLAEPELEEIASDAILKLVGQIEKVITQDHAEALVKLIARRGAVSLIRKASAEKRSQPDAGTGMLSGSGILPDDSSSEGLTDTERCELVVLLRRVLQDLDPQTRRILLERAEGLTSTEISSKHGIPLGTVCPQIARALAAARAQLQKYPGLMKELRNYLR